MELRDTIDGMLSNNYKERFIAEYFQTKIRYEKLRNFNTKIEASIRSNYKIPMPKHDCTDIILKEQQSIMGNYLRLLEVRAEIEGIDLYSNIQVSKLNTKVDENSEV